MNELNSTQIGSMDIRRSQEHEGSLIPRENNPNICTCDCHQGMEVGHLTPCCDPCPHCNQNIIRGWLNIHAPCCKADMKAQETKPAVHIVSQVLE